MITWVMCTISGRVVCGIIIVSSRDVLEGLPLALDHLFGGNGQAQLFFVMVTCPLIMNALQAYIQVRRSGGQGRLSGSCQCCAGVGEYSVALQCVWLLMCGSWCAGARSTAAASGCCSSGHSRPWSATSSAAYVQLPSVRTLACAGSTSPCCTHHIAEPDVRLCLPRPAPPQDHILKFKRAEAPARGSQGGAGPAPGCAAADAADAADADGKAAGGKPGDRSKQVIVVTMEAA